MATTPGVAGGNSARQRRTPSRNGQTWLTFAHSTLRAWLNRCIRCKSVFHCNIPNKAHASVRSLAPSRLAHNHASFAALPRLLGPTSLCRLPFDGRSLEVLGHHHRRSSRRHHGPLHRRFRRAVVHRQTSASRRRPTPLRTATHLVRVE